MAKVAVIIDDLFEDAEYLKPAAAFKEAGHEIVHVGIKTAGQEIKGKKQGTTVKIDKKVDDVSTDEFDALLIPGGYSPDHLRTREEAVSFAREFMEKDKPVFSICHGPQLLITAKALEGRRVAGWKSIAQDIRYAGAEYVDQEVVEDGNLVSSRQPSDLPSFIRACLRKLK